jgi:hypothetical protein
MAATSTTLDQDRRALLTEVEQQARERRRLLCLREQPTLPCTGGGRVVAPHVGDPPVQPLNEVAAEQALTVGAAG